MFLVELQMNVSKAEISKLDDKMQSKEQAIAQSEAMLDDDIAKFDAFLQANDAKAHEAVRFAEEMTQKKQEKQQKIRALKAQIASYEVSISKQREVLDEYVAYRSFLERLTPQDWIEAHRKKVAHAEAKYKSIAAFRIGWSIVSVKLRRLWKPTLNPAS